MKMICINNNGHEHSLTNGKEYKILSSNKILSCSKNFYSLIDDNGSHIKVWETRFEKIPLRHQDCRCSMPTSKDKAKNMLNTKTTYITTDCAKFDDLDIAIAYQEMINKDNDKVFGITKEEFMGNSDVFAKKILEAFDLIKNKGDK